MRRKKRTLGLKTEAPPLQHQHQHIHHPKKKGKKERKKKDKGSGDGEHTRVLAAHRKRERMHTGLQSSSPTTPEHWEGRGAHSQGSKSTDSGFWHKCFSEKEQGPQLMSHRKHLFVMLVGLFTVVIYIPIT